MRHHNWFLIVLFLFHGINQCRGQNWDVNLLKSINPEHPDSKYWKTSSVSAFAVPGLLSVGTLIYGLSSDSKSARQNAYQLLLSIAANTLVSETLKLTINEERPADKYPTAISVNSKVHGKSFPSGHAALAFTTATTISLEYHKWYVTVPAFLWAGSVGYSRMYLGKHYPTDVLAGAALGIGTGYLSHWLSRQIFNPYKLKNIPNDCIH
jgi:membrane-associated phospholipid phosphatase